MKMRNRLIPLAAAVACTLSLGPTAFGGPAGAAGITTSATTVSDDAPGVMAGGSFTFTANVSGLDGTPTGTVDWLVSGPSTVTCSPSMLDVNGNGTCAVTDANAGTYTATATYDGDGTYNGSSGMDTTAIVATAPSTTTVSDDAAGVMAGGSFTFTANVSGLDGTPTGTVDWLVSGPSTVTCSPSMLDVSGDGTCAVTVASAGTYSATATYVPPLGGNYSGGSGMDTTAMVAAATSTTKVSDDAAGVVAGGSFTFTASVSGSAGTPSGTVDWSVSGPSTVNCSPATLNGLGKGTCAVSDARAGTYSGTATYSGDDTYSGGSGSDMTASVGTAPSTTTVSDNSSGKVTGGTFMFTATVSGAVGAPTGTVTWSVSGLSTIGIPIPLTCPNSTLNSSKATCTVTGASAGTYSATATYDGDGSYSGSSGSDTTATVARAPSTSPTISNLPTGGTFGGGFVATVSVTTGDGVRFVTSNSSGVCTVSGGLTVSYVGAGTCSLTAQVATGANYLAATGGAQSFTVARAAPSTPTVTNIPTAAVEFAGFTAIVGTNGDGTTSVVSNTPSVCSVQPDGLTVFFLTTGACTVTAGVEPGANYQGRDRQTADVPGRSGAAGILAGRDPTAASSPSAPPLSTVRWAESHCSARSSGSHPRSPVAGTGSWRRTVASSASVTRPSTAPSPASGCTRPDRGCPTASTRRSSAWCPTINRHGYFMVASDGGVFAFGDAKFEGSCPGIGGCAGTAVAVMPDRTGQRVLAGHQRRRRVLLRRRAVLRRPAGRSRCPWSTPWPRRTDRGYWLLYANGVVANFGDAVNFGAPIGYVNSFNPANAIFPTADGNGYWVASTRGDVFSYGNAP